MGNPEYKDYSFSLFLFGVGTVSIALLILYILGPK